MDLEIDSSTHSLQDILLAPFRYLTDSRSRVFLYYLASSLLIALAVHYFGERRKGKSLPGMLQSFRHALPIFTHRSAVVDYLYFIPNAMLYVVILAPVAMLGTWWSHTLFGLLSFVAEPIQVVQQPGPVAIVIYSVAVALAADFGTFYSHLLFHRIPFLWEFHKVHHSAEVLTPMTVYRMHPIDDMVTLSISGSMVGTVDGLMRFFIAPGMTPYVVYGLGVGTFFFYVLGYNLRHSHIWWSYGPGLSRIFISPAQHQIHHSKARKHWDKNFGLMLAVWDWMFGTLYVPVERENIEFGIGNGEEREFSSPARLYLVPFIKAGRRIKKKVKRLFCSTPPAKALSPSQETPPE